MEQMEQNGSKANDLMGAKHHNVGLHREGSPYSDAECEDIISKLEQMLDGELDPKQERSIADMVNTCDYCLEQYKIEKSMRKLIKNGFQNVVVSTDLVQNIKKSIQEVRQQDTK